MKRVVLYPKDISQLLGKSLSTAYRIYRAIRVLNGKVDNQYVTVDEAAKYLGINKDEILSQLG